MRRLAGRRVAVTGAGGFIGSALVRRLVAEGVEVRALLGPDDAQASVPGPGAGAAKGVQTLRGEIDRPDCLSALLDGAEVVFHLAGPASVARSFAAPAEFARIHGTGTATLLAACERARVQHVIYLSSAEVYGRPLRNPIDETHRLQACSPYAAAKLAAEHFLEAYHLSHGLAVTVLRPFSVYGPRQSPHGLVAVILRQLDHGEVRLADLRPVRDFCYVDDVVDAAVRAAAAGTALGSSSSKRWWAPRKSPRPSSWHLVLNVGSGVGTSVEALASLIVRLRGSDVRVVGGEAADRPEAGMILQRVADTSRIRTLLGWEAQTPLEVGLHRTLSWWDAEGRRGQAERAAASGPGEFR
jgi:nucleoside-diphosphate-sugar epimerase